MKRILISALTITGLLLLSSTMRLPATSPIVRAQGDLPPIVSVFTTQPPEIDGQLRAGEWDAATFEPFTFFMLDLTTGQDTISIPADLYLMNDQKNLYVGLQMFGVPYNNPGVAGRGFDLVALLFDNNNNGLYEVGEDQKLLLTVQPNIDHVQRGAYLDLHIAPEGEDGADLHIDGLGRIVHSDVNGIGDYTAELVIPLNPGDPDDLSTSMNGRVRFNLVLLTQLEAATEGGGLFGLDFVNTSDWGVIQLQAGPAPPDSGPQLSGTMTFISREFQAGRQVYVMNADGTNLRSRSRGDQIVGTPFLSPDGQTIVYTSTQPERPETQEIYSLNTNRGFARRLTNNNVPDTHPVLSPTGREIVFARGGNIWAMDANGRNERQLTNVGADTDPVWAPDGRIVFASFRWREVPEIAVMNADGSNLTRITDNEKGSFNPRVSPDGQWATFFRYNGPGSIFDFGVSLFHPWNIYRIRLDGTGEQQLTDDGLLNYMPAFSPDGRGILYQKVLDVNSFYTVLHYLDLQTGQDRLTLNLSRVETFDWR